MEQLDLFKKEPEKKREVLKPPKEIEIKTTDNKENKTETEEKKYVQLIRPLSKTTEKKPSKRGRKSFKEINLDVALLDIPDDETLSQKQYYSITEVAEWFHVNASLIRFWEKEFDILNPRKNRKGDRMFRPEDVKNLRIIYYLLRQQKYSMEGAKQFLKDNHKRAEMQTQLVETLTKFRSFLLELRANLGA
jgi:DNA-binding transcriptional MerR regulator